MPNESSENNLNRISLSEALWAIVICTILTTGAVFLLKLIR